MKHAFQNFRESHLGLFRGARDVSVMLLASVCFGGGMELFLAPNAMNAGGFIGIAQILSIWAPSYLYLGILYVLVNIPVIVLSAFFFSKKFVCKTAAIVLVTGVIMMLLRMFDVSGRLGLSDVANMTLLSLAGGAVTAVGIALTLSVEASAGGTDIITLMLQKRYKMSNVSRLFLVFDIAVIALYAILIKSLNSFFYSFTALAAYQITLELVFNSFSNAVMFEIVTDDSAAVISAITKELDRGSTVFKAVGTYTRSTKEVVICVVRKRQEAKARELIKKVAPECFAYTLPIKEVIGKGFRNVNF